MVLATQKNYYTHEEKLLRLFCAKKLCRFAKGEIYHTSKTVRSRSPTQECFNICRLRSNIKYKTILQKLLQKMLHFVLSSQCQIHLKYVIILNKHKLFFSLGNNGQTYRREMDNGFNHYI